MKPFDKVIFRNIYTNCWGIGLYSNLYGKDTHIIVGIMYPVFECFPYKDEYEKYIGTKESLPVDSK